MWLTTLCLSAFADPTPADPGTSPADGPDTIDHSGPTIEVDCLDGLDPRGLPCDPPIEIDPTCGFVDVGAIPQNSLDPDAPLAVIVGYVSCVNYGDEQFVHGCDSGPTSSVQWEVTNRTPGPGVDPLPPLEQIGVCVINRANGVGVLYTHDVRLSQGLAPVAVDTVQDPSIIDMSGCDGVAATGERRLQIQSGNGADIVGPHRGVPRTCFEVSGWGGARTEFRIHRFTDANGNDPFGLDVEPRGGGDLVFGTEWPDQMHAGDPTAFTGGFGREGDDARDLFCGFDGDDELLGSDDDALGIQECFWGGDGTDLCDANAFVDPGNFTVSQDRADSCEITEPTPWTPMPIDAACDSWQAPGTSAPPIQVDPLCGDADQSPDLIPLIFTGAPPPGD